MKKCKIKPDFDLIPVVGGKELRVELKCLYTVIILSCMLYTDVVVDV